MDHKSKRPNVSSLFVRVNICLLFSAIFTVTTGFAEDKPLSKPELVTDRPDQTESSVAVPPGYVQLETGWTFSRNKADGIRNETHEFPGTLLRIGVLDPVEFRLGWNGGIWEGTRKVGQRNDLGGAGDMGVGTKLYFWEEQGWIPEVALLAGVSLPVGKEELSSQRSEPTFRVSLSHTLSDRVSLGYNLGATWESDLDETSARDRFSLFNYTAVLGIGLTERAGMFVEVFGDVPLSANGGPANSFDGGLTYLLRDNLQVDAALGVGISEEADDWFVGLGITVRLPR